MQQTALKWEPKYLTSNSKNTESLAKNCINMELPQANTFFLKTHKITKLTFTVAGWEKLKVWGGNAILICPN